MLLDSENKFVADVLKVLSTSPSLEHPCPSTRKGREGEYRSKELQKRF